MPTLQVIDMNNRAIETIEMEGNVFSAPANRSLVHRAVVMQRAGVRQGTAATRGRGEVQGSNKKTLEAKAHGACEGWLGEFSNLASWGNGLWPQAATLWFSTAEEKL